MNARFYAALMSGILFGVGLVISDMINPGRVLAFLDVAGRWDPSLAFVMGGALVPSFIAYRIRARLDAPLLDKQFHVPTSKTLDARLIAGAILFGLGWGLVGLCPGPALAGIVVGRWEILLFVAAMLLGMFAHKVALPLMDKAQTTSFIR